MMITVHYANIQHVFQSDIYTCSGRHRGIYWSKASLGPCLEWYYNLTWSLHLLQNWLSVILRNNHIWSKMTLYWVNSDILKCIVSDIITLREIKWVYKGFPLLQSDPWDLYSGVIYGTGINWPWHRRFWFMMYFFCTPRSQSAPRYGTNWPAKAPRIFPPLKTSFLLLWNRDIQPVNWPWRRRFWFSMYFFCRPRGRSVPR